MEEKLEKPGTPTPKKSKLFPRTKVSVFRLALLGFLSNFIISPAFALDEAVVMERMINLYSQDLECGENQDVPAWKRYKVTNTNDGYDVRYSRFGCSLGERGSVVLLPGRGEGSFEYYETAIDFIDRGFGPIYVIDHRGQGLSPRLLEDPHKGHVTDFEDYVDDAQAFVTAVKTDLDQLGAGSDPAMYLTSNSMGGAIGIGLLQRMGAENPFRAAALLGAMIDVNYHSFTGTSASWLNLHIYSETGALMQASLRCGIATYWNEKRCEEYAVKSAANGYQPGTRRFTENTQAKMTHSQARYDLRTHMLDSFDWSKIAEEEYTENESWSGPQLGGATNGWVLQAARFNSQMRQADKLEKMVHVPIMLLTGSEDLRAYNPYAQWLDRKPDLSRHTEFCNDLNAASTASTGKTICQFVSLDGGYHELYKERDLERAKALDTVDWYFRFNAQTETETNPAPIAASK